MDELEFKLDMDYLIFVWQDESPDNAYYLDKETGNVKLVQRGLIDLGELTDEIEQDRHRYLYIPKPDSRQTRKDVEDFANTITDSSLKSILAVGMESPDPLQALKTILARKPDELKRWENFRMQLINARIEKWLKANFISAESEGSGDIDFSPS